MPHEQQLDFEARSAAPTSRKGSQCDRILELLKDRAGKPVPMPELSRVGSGKVGGFCMVHSRVADLRKRGHVIEQSQEWVNGSCHSFYTWVSGPVSVPLPTV